MMFSLVKSAIMRWRIRRANIPENERDVFDRYGEAVISTIVAGAFLPDALDLRALFGGPVLMVQASNQHARDWLTERGDIAERRATRDFLLEIAIIALIGIEIGLGAWGLHEGNEQAKILSDVNANIDRTATTLQTLEETQRTALAALQSSSQELTSKPDVQVLLFRTDSGLRMKGRNASQLKPAASSYCDFFVWNLDQANGDSFQLDKGTDHFGDLAPWQVSGLNVIVDGYRYNTSPAYAAKNRLLVYIRANCPDCAKPRAYWAMLTLGTMDGHYIETIPIDPLVLSPDQLRKKAGEMKTESDQQAIAFTLN